MRLWLLGGVLLLGSLVAYVRTIETRLERASRVGWEQVCWHLPLQTVTPLVREGLREARVVVGAHGWQPTPDWLNDQCDALGYGHG